MSDPISDEWNDLPMMLTVEDAACVLRIGRSHAYNLTKVYFASGGVEGLPVLRLGDVLRIPKAALQEFMTTGRIVQLTVSRVDDTPAAQPLRYSNRHPSKSQITLLTSN